MHSIVLLGIFGLAWYLRYAWAEMANNTWLERWHRTLTLFLLPPLLLCTSAIAIIWMGPHGRMVWVGNDWLSYDLAVSFLGFATLYWLKLAGSGWLMLRQVRTCPIVQVSSNKVRILDLPIPYSAQIGFWEPELVIAQGLLDTLPPEHLEAVLAHEQAHYQYRDTWCFFWLGWVRQITKWLPQTEFMWQELLLLRELRADRWASTQTDPLLVAEALLSIVQQTPVFPEHLSAAFSQMTATNRLDCRIDALFNATEPIEHSSILAWAWLLLALLPLFAIPFHI